MWVNKQLNTQLDQFVTIALEVYGLSFYLLIYFWRDDLKYLYASKAKFKMRHVQEIMDFIYNFYLSLPSYQ